jgi:hypothetical protein
MFFAVITFFTKFATILFFTILQGTIGSFVVFLGLTDCFGPSRPTATVDWVTSKLWWGDAKEREPLVESRVEREVVPNEPRGPRGDPVYAKREVPNEHIVPCGDPVDV